MSVSNDKRTAVARSLAAAGDPNRLRLLCLLFRSRRACVSQLAESLGLSVATASHHLRALQREGILNSERDGKSICYFLSSDPFVLDLKKLICKHI